METIRDVNHNDFILLADRIKEKLDFEAEVTIERPLDYVIKVKLNRWKPTDGVPRTIHEFWIKEIKVDGIYYYVNFILEVNRVGDTRQELQYLVDTFDKTLNIVKEVIEEI